MSYWFIYIPPYINKTFSRLRSPEFFLALTVLVALLSVFSLRAGFWAGIALIFIVFRLKQGCFIAVIYVAALFISSHSVFILDIDYSGGKRTLITTKGKISGLPFANATVGDLLWGSFKYDVQRTKKGVPRLSAELSGDYTLHKIFIVSSLLKARQHQSATMFNRSGGKIHITQAHIYAIRSYITGKERDEYVITGLAHLLAMSGFHVGIFTAGIFFIFFFIPRKTRIIPAIIMLPLLIPLSGFAITVVRAVFFAMAALIGWSADLKVISLRFLALLAGFILLFSPFSLFSISFLLSFFAVFGIIMLFKTKYTYIKGIVIVGVACSVFIMPIQLYFFGTA
ncbi:MAG: ComEC/Rec2 family competence protein, partial [Deferribacteraceae bacterium]|nr:ComEC/Rec2 family competence protein [Deferribacteraceae bacterium]